MNHFSRYFFCVLLLLVSWQVAPCQILPKPTEKPFNRPGEDANFERYLTSGRVTVVAFYADWCPSCRSWAPLLDAVNADFPDMQVVFMDIDEWDTPVTEKYGFASIPHLKIYDGEGRLVIEGSGAKDWLRQAISQRLLARAQGNYRLANDRVKVTLSGVSRSVSSRPPNSGTSPRAQTAQVAASSPREKIESSGPLPSVDQVFARYADALGGLPAAAKVRTHSAKGKVNISTMGRGSFATYFKAPNKVITTIEIPEIGVMRQGFNGASGWSQGPRNAVRAATKSELETLKRDADFYSWADLKSRYQRLKVLGVAKIGYRDAYLVEAKPTAGYPEKLYFSKDSGLLIRWDVVRMAAGVKTSAEVYLDDWTDVGGLKMPFTITQLFPRLSIVFSFDEVKHDVVVDDAVFNRPGTR